MVAGCETLPGIHNHKLYDGCVTETGGVEEKGRGEGGGQEGDEGQKDLFRSASGGWGSVRGGEVERFSYQ